MGHRNSQSTQEKSKMTEDQIKNYPTGLELDRLIAENIFQLDPDNYIHYSELIEDAWQIILKLSDIYHWRIQSPFEKDDLW